MAVQIIILYGIPKKLAAVSSLALAAVYVCCLLQSSIPSATGPGTVSAGIPLSHSIDRMAAGIPAGDMYNCTTVVPSADRVLLSASTLKIINP